MKKALALLIFVVLFTVKCDAQTKVKNKNTSEKVLMVIAPEDFRDEEYTEPKVFFEKQGLTVITASTTTEFVYGSRKSIKVKPDILLKDVKVSEFDAIIFVGGPGAREYYNNSEALRIAKQSFNNNKITAAICVAPNILCNSGILKGKKATAWAFEVENCQVKEVDENVVKDGNIITANGPDSALKFAEEIYLAILKHSTYD